jgi:hypothetical protein
MCTNEYIISFLFINVDVIVGLCQVHIFISEHNYFIIVSFLFVSLLLNRFFSHNNTNDSKS